MRLPFVTLVFSLLAVAAVLVCALHDLPWLALAPVGLVAVYLVAGLALSQGDPDEIEWAADQVYFLGYVSTITAFAGVVLRAWLLGEGLDDPRPVLLMGGVALLTTVAGLVGMTFLRAHARVLAAEEWPARSGRAAAAAGVAAAPAGMAQPAPAPALAVVPAPLAAAPPAVAGSPELGLVTERAVQTIAGLGEQLQALGQSLAALDHAVARSSPEVATLSRNVAELQAVIDAFVTHLGSALDRDHLRAGEGGR